MEASSMIMMKPSSSSCCLKTPTSSSMMGFSPASSLKIGGFCEKGQLEYYKSSIRCGGEKRKVKVEEKKKKKKGVKLLNRNLSVFYGMGFGLDSEYYQQKEMNDVGLAHQVKFNMMSEAAELLLEQLKQVKKEDKELKKKMKMEEKKKRKAEMKSTASVSCLDSSESSSSSSSESSDSESDNEMVVDLNRLKPSSVCTPAEVPVIVPSIPTLQEDVDVLLLPPTSAAEGEETYPRTGEGVISGLGIRGNQEKNRLGAELAGMVGKKIEVCMGGKCKKSGAATLIDEFQKVVGFNDDIVVSGCKCMGKCKNGPNVRVVNSPSSEAAPPPPSNPLCLGVGVEDVGLIVSNFFGDESRQNGILGVPAAAMN
ncbi:hypothetical protein Leryth_017374 [Lithospermum erythrorhizon]|nr:hypothetical protein Leryth_017374 [Lithospermum erythrorhizon]